MKDAPYYRPIALTQAQMEPQDSRLSRLGWTEEKFEMLNKMLEALTPEETERFNSEFVKFLGLGAPA